MLRLTEVKRVANVLVIKLLSFVCVGSVERQRKADCWPQATVDFASFELVWSFSGIW
jgi:hypothetical protein